MSDKVSTNEQLRILHNNESGLDKGTVASHKAAWGLWTEFLRGRSRSGQDDPDPMLVRCSPREASWLVTLWLYWLREQRNKSADRLPTLLSNLKSNWTTANRTADFDNSVPPIELKRTLKSLGPSENEIRLRLRRQEGSVCLPISADMVRQVRRSLFEKPMLDGITIANLDKMGGFLAMSVGLETIQRGVSWVTTDADRAIKTQDICWRVEEGDANVSDLEVPKAVEVRGDEARAMLKGNGSKEDLERNLPRILQISMDFLKTKPGKATTGVVVARRSLEEAEILEDMGRWLVLSGTKDDDPFLTRYGTTPRTKKEGSRRVVLARDCSRAVKAAAREVGLPDKFFGIRSLRKGGVSTMFEAGVTLEDIRVRAGHAAGSGVTNKHYNYSLEASRGGRGMSVGPSGLSKRHRFNAERVRELLPFQTDKGREPGEKRGGEGRMESRAKRKGCDSGLVREEREGEEGSAKKCKRGISRGGRGDPTEKTGGSPKRRTKARECGGQSTAEGTTEGTDKPTRETREKRTRTKKPTYTYDRMASPTTKR